MTYLESDLDLVTVLVRLGGHVRLQHPQDTPQKLLSAECLSVVEALAAGFSLDISSVEAKHATNREMAMLKNRGWVESLQCISAKYISKCVGQLSARFKVVFGRAFETKPTPPPTASETNPSQKKTRSKAGGGGAWRAFCHFKSQNIKFTVQGLQALSDEYRKLPASEKQKYVESGKAAALARKAGFASYPKAPKQRNSSKLSTGPKARARELLPGDSTSSGAIVGVDAATAMQMRMLYEGKDSFMEGYELIKRSKIAPHDVEGDAPLTKEEETQVARFEADTKSTWTVSHLHNSGFSRSADSFQHSGEKLRSFLSLEWFPPVASICQAHLLKHCLLTCDSCDKLLSPLAFLTSHYIYIYIYSH